MEVFGDTLTIVDDRQAADIRFAIRCDIDCSRISITRITEHLDNDILNATDVMFGLSAFSFLAAQADETAPQVFLDTQMSSSGDLLDEIYEVTVTHFA
jgi:hypothetical protein